MPLASSQWYSLILLASGKSKPLFSRDVSRVRQLAEVNSDWPANGAESTETSGRKKAEENLKSKSQ
ncbi:MAG: hypothetical protein ISS41_12030 [Candidatus Aminicenantes bacterium]|nr:hypothetical protein [Candidatus Aminicenantes bacterium]